MTLKKHLMTLVGAALILMGCDDHKIAQLEVGIADEAAVRAQFGDPAMVYDEGGGSRTFEYPRQPQGQRNYMITLDASGKMSALRQVLKPENFHRITPGLDSTQVRRILGAPARRLPIERKGQEIWNWRFLNGNDSMIFLVTFDAKGKVLSTAQEVDEPR